MYLYVCKQTFDISRVLISQNVIGTIILFLCEDKDIERFSYLHYYIFSVQNICWFRSYYGCLFSLVYFYIPNLHKPVFREQSKFNTHTIYHLDVPRDNTTYHSIFCSEDHLRKTNSNSSLNFSFFRPRHSQYSYYKDFSLPAWC